MRMRQIYFKGFRNFITAKFEFPAKITIIIGDNATGKSNILEGIYLMATGKSYKAGMEEEMVNYDSGMARIVGVSSIDEGKNPQIHNIKYDVQDTKLEVVLTRGEIEHEGGRLQKTPRKKLLVNGVPRRLIDFAGNLKAVLFGPWDLDLVTESPSVRRKFLDNVLSQVDREYRRALLAYERGVRQRNRLLIRIRDEAIPVGRQGVSRSQFLFWNSLLIKNGDYISKKREEFIEYINKLYTPISRSKIGGTFSVEYDKSAISEARLEQYKDAEVAAGMTLVGPHRDDFVIKLKAQSLKRKGSAQESVTTDIERNLATYGSRGEQRMGVLWLKLAELSYIENVTDEKPILLLDDIFSELDHEHRDIVITVADNQQTIITTADPHYIEKVKGAEKIQLESSQ